MAENPMGDADNRVWMGVAQVVISVVGTALVVRVVGGSLLAVGIMAVFGALTALASLLRNSSLSSLPH